MKNLKFLFAAAFLAAAVLSWKITSENIVSERDAFYEYISKAQYHDDKGAYVTAAEYYKKALEFEPDNSELLMLAAQSSLMSGNSTDFIQMCRKAASADPDDPEPYLMLSEYYCGKNEYDTALSVLKSAPPDDVTDDMIRQISAEFRDEYKKYYGVRGFSGGYCAVLDDRGKWGLISRNGGLVLSYIFDEAGAYDPDEDAVPVCMDGEWYFADLEGKKKYVPEEPYEWIGAFSEGYAPFKREGRYGYTDSQYNETETVYDFAGSFYDGTAAVSREGKWALAGTDMELLTDFEFDLIETDEYGFCGRSGNIYALKSGKRICIDRNGKEIPFSEKYVCGLAPAEVNGKWGYFNDEGTLAIDAVYEKALPFSENGSALVKENGMWHIITLRIMENHSML